MDDTLLIIYLCHTLDYLYSFQLLLLIFLTSFEVYLHKSSLPSSLPIMSAAAEGSGPTTKATTSTDTSSTLKDQQKPAAALEEDDEFEDFPVDGIPARSCPEYREEGKSK